MTMMALRPPANPGPLTMTLVLDSQVFLFSAELVEDCGDHSQVVSATAKTIDSAEWRVDKCPPTAAEISVGITYVGVHSQAPNHPYNATLTVTDSQGNLLQPHPPYQNPMRVPGETGPADNPTDMGRFGVVVA